MTEAILRHSLWRYAHIHMYIVYSTAHDLLKDIDRHQEFEWLPVNLRTTGNIFMHACSYFTVNGRITN